MKFWVRLKRHAPYFGVTDILPMVVTSLLTLLAFWIDTHSVCLGLLLLNLLLEAIFGWELLKTLPTGNGELPSISKDNEKAESIFKHPDSGVARGREFKRVHDSIKPPVWSRRLVAKFA